MSEFLQLFNFGKVVWDPSFSHLFDSDQIDVAVSPKTSLEEKLLNLCTDEDMFDWEYKQYRLHIGFYGHNDNILCIKLSYCDDWDDEEKGVASCDNPIKSVICKSKDDVTKAVTEMLEYVGKRGKGVRSLF